MASVARLPSVSFKVNRSPLTYSYYGMKISYNDYNEQSYHVINIITVLLKCAGDVQEVPTHKPLHQVLYLKINKEQIK